MYKRLQSVLSTHTARQSLITAVATFLSAGLGAVFHLILARSLGASDYGLFSLSLTVLVLVATIADVGMGQGIIRFVGKYSSSEGYLPFARLALHTKILFGFLSWLILWLISQPLATHVLHQPKLGPLLPIVGFGAFSFLLVSYSVSISQALQKFYLWGILQVGPNLLRLFIFGSALWLLGSLTPTQALMAFSSAALAGFIFSWVALDRRIFTSQSGRYSVYHIKQFWDFNKWTASFMLLSTFVSRLDLILSGRFLNLSYVGSYSLAVTMVSFLPQLSTAIGAVTSAKFSGMNDKKSAKVYLLKATLFSTAIGICIGLLMIPVALLVIHFVGGSYSNSFVPFLVLLLSFIMFMAGNPLRDYLLYFYNRPHIFFWANLLQGIALVLLSPFLIPSLGILGTAFSVLASHIVLALFCLWYFLKSDKK